MSIQVTLSANAGVSLALGGRRIWVDALHDTPTGGFSTLTPEMLSQMERHTAFQDPDMMVFTHCHGDHYSHALTAQARARWPRARLVLPERRFADQELLEGAEVAKTLGDIRLRFFRLTHEHPETLDVPHYGLLLSCGGKNVLLAGDCAIASPELADAVGNTPVDLALLNFPWLALSRGRRYIAERLHPAHLLVYHLPFPADDTAGYRAAVERAAALLPPCPDIRILGDFLQTERYD